MDIKRWWRRFNRSPYIPDLRLIQPRYRHLYRDAIYTGLVGKALGSLVQAYDHGHLKSQSNREG